MFRVSTGKFVFWLTGKSIFMMANGQKMLFTNYDNSDIKPHQYAELCDLIYRRKIVCFNDLYEVMGRYKLISTQRNLK